MNNRLIVLLIMIIGLGILLSCAPKEVEKKDSSRQTIKWTGEYSGVVPNYDNDGTYMELELRKDMTFTLGKKKQGTMEEIKNIKGTLAWSKNGNDLILESYSEVEKSVIGVSKNKVFWRSMKGITFDEAMLANYSLTRTPKDLIGKTWNIKSINSEIVNVRPAENNDNIYLSFSNKDNSINGFGGCNYFKVYYHLVDDNIVFMPVQSTKMTGSNIETENKLFNIFTEVRKVEVNGNILLLSNDIGTNLLIAELKQKAKPLPNSMLQ